MFKGRVIKIISSKYKVGIIFCGGCNPLFDREKLSNDIMNKFSSICDFSLYSKNSNYDLIILINGCSSECLIESKYKGKLFVINNPNSINDISTALNSSRTR